MEMPVDPDQVETVFLSAVRCAEVADRERVLEQECGSNSELRDRVTALLRAHDAAGELPAVLVGLSTFHDEPPAYAPGTLIAERYRLVEEIATGGMGSVWLAQQVAPVHRQVALKLIKPGMDTRGMWSRFESERQALAVMEHSNIARVFDGGLTDEGRPFFVMEYILGLAITDYCDRARLSVKERVKLFVPVCRALHHAHQKGIIHRDLKPSNVLVSMDDDQAVPKIIDFGLAKVAREPSAPEGLILGTPRYMSPEQADQNNLDIDTRADVYSLGVILYELLTGSTPLDEWKSEGVPLFEVLRRSRQKAPSWPSVRLARHDLPPAIAAARMAEPSQLERAVRGDLDWIVMKAIQKDRSQRYESANDLGRDLERYLLDEPVMAHPPSVAYRARKFTWRHRLAIAAAMLVSATLVISTMVSTALAIRATRARADEALHRQEAEHRRARAEANFRDARKIMDHYFTSLMENKTLNVPELLPLRKELLDSAMEYYVQLVQQHGGDQALEAELAHAYYEMGGRNYSIGAMTLSIEALEEAARRYERLAKQHPDVSRLRWQQANVHNDIGSLLLNLGRRNDAEASFRRALKIYRELLAGTPQDLPLRASEARTYIRLGNLQTISEEYTEAEIFLRRAIDLHIEILKEDPHEIAYRWDLASAYRYLGSALRATGRFVEAQASLEESGHIFRQLDRDSGGMAGFQAGIAIASYGLGHVHRLAEDVDAARSAYHRAIEQSQACLDREPSSISCRRQIGGAYFHLGLLDLASGDRTQAEKNWTTALDVFRAVAELGFDSTGFFSGQADALAMLGRWDEAIEMLAKTLDRGDYNWRHPCQLALLRWTTGDLEQHRAACRELIARRRDVAGTSELSGIALTCLVDRQALDDFSPLLAIAQAAVRTEPSNPAHRAVLGAAQYRAGQNDEALQTLRQSLPLLESLPTYTSPEVDRMRSSRLLGETILLLVHRERNEESALARQRLKVEALLEQWKSTAPVYCDEADRWRVGFTVLFAERELASREPSLAIESTAGEPACVTAPHGVARQEAPRQDGQCQ